MGANNHPTVVPGEPEFSGYEQYIQRAKWRLSYYHRND